MVLNYQNLVFASIRRQGVEEAIAKELCQEVFIKAYKGISSFRFEASFTTWLLKIATNHTISYFSSKRFKQRQKTIALEAQMLEQHAGGDCYDHEAIERLKQIVSQLEPKYREVLVLCGFEQLPYQEVAKALDIPVGTVRSRLHTARKLAKELYFKEEAD